jgi:hypothetical protein
MMSLDIYLNETTRHADVVLPGLSPLEQSHYDLALRQLAVRNVPPIRRRVRGPRGPSPGVAHPAPLLGVVAGAGGDVAALDALVAGQAAAGGPMPEGRVGPNASSTSCCAPGPTPDARRSRGLPHGIDLGPLEPRLPGALRTPSGRSSSRPSPSSTTWRGCGPISARTEPPLTLVGRRDLRSNNSWMHNLEVLVKGRSAARCASTPTTRRASG